MAPKATSVANTKSTKGVHAASVSQDIIFGTWGDVANYGNAAMVQKVTVKEPVILEDSGANRKFFDFELKDLQAKKAQAHIGYLSIDLYKPPDGAFWGKWNNCRVIPDWINGLVAMFKSSGVNNCTDSTAIDIAVKREWVANLAEKCNTVKGKSIDEVPEI